MAESKLPFVKYIPFLFLLLTSLLFSCTEPVEEKKPELLYVITHGEPPGYDSMPSPPPMSWYGHHNFVLGDSGRIFHHSRQDPGQCFYGDGQNKPPRIHMLPGHFKEIKFESLKVFLMRNVLDTTEEGDTVFATISYRTDTITNPGYTVIKNHFRNTGIKNYLVRNWTEEEKFTLTAGLNKKTYYTDSVEFKIGFCGSKLSH
jgi:hypothetical protein